MSKTSYIITGIMFIIASLIIYMTKGPSYSIFPEFRVFRDQFILHLFWTFILSFLGIALVIIGLEKKE